jgi:hypothetical protein
MRQLLCFLIGLLFIILPSSWLIAQSKMLPDLSAVPNEPGLFAAGIISTNLYERDMAISPDGQEMFYTLQSPLGLFSTLMYLHKNEKGIWSNPQVASFSGIYSDMEPAFTQDGQKLFFVSNRSVSGDSLKDFDIWQVEKKENMWVHPVNIGAPVNTAENEFYPSVAANGNLYFTANYLRGRGKEDIYLARWENGKYAEPVSLDSAVNSPLYEFNAYVSPDENFIVFTSYGRKDDIGRGDLYISLKDATGHWQQAKNLQWLNSPRLDYCPFVSFDKKIFFFTSERNGIKEKYEGHPANYQQLKDSYLGLMNGNANIYWVSFESVMNSLK